MLQKSKLSARALNILPAAPGVFSKDNSLTFLMIKRVGGKTSLDEAVIETESV